MNTSLFNVNKYIQPCAFFKKDCAICINFNFYDLDQTTIWRLKPQVHSIVILF